MQAMVDLSQQWDGGRGMQNSDLDRIISLNCIIDVPKNASRNDTIIGSF